MKYELPSTELIVIEENNYLKFGEYLNDMQCDDTINKLCLDDLGYVKKLQQDNKELNNNWNKLKEYLHNVDFVIDYSENFDGRFINYDELIDKMQEIEQGSDSNE